MEGEAVCLALLPARDLLATGGTDGLVRLWHARTGTPLSVCIGHSGTVRDVQFSPDGKQLVSCGSDGAVLVWNVF